LRFASVGTVTHGGRLDSNQAIAMRVHQSRASALLAARRLMQRRHSSESRKYTVYVTAGPSRMPAPRGTR